MTADGGLTRITSKRAKKAYQKRGQPTLSEKEKRQIARNLELERRAEAIREKEQRKKDNAKKREEKEAKQREERRRMGVAEPVDEGYVSPRQTRMEGFFRKQANVQEDTVRTSDMEGAGKGRPQDTKAPNEIDGVGVEDEDEDEDRQLDDDEPVIANFLNEERASEVEDPANNEPDKPVEQITKPSLKANVKQQSQSSRRAIPDKVVSKRPKRKRKDLSRASSSISNRSLPNRGPYRTNSDLYIDKREIWIPPSMDTIHQEREPNVDSLKVPLPVLPWPKPSATSPALAHRTQPVTQPQDMTTPKKEREVPQNVSSSFPDFEFGSSQLDELDGLEKLIDETTVLQKRKEPDEGQEDAELPTLPNGNRLEAVNRERTALENRPHASTDAALAHLTELFSDESVFSIDAPRGLAHAAELFSDPIDDEDLLAEADRILPIENGNIRKMDDDEELLGMRSSDFSPLALTQMLLPLTQAEKEESCHDESGEQEKYDKDRHKDGENEHDDARTEIFDPTDSDEFEISTEDADAFEQAALDASVKARQPITPESMRTILGNASAAPNTDDSTPKALGPLESGGSNQLRDNVACGQEPPRRVNESFGFGGFDFSSQEINTLELESLGQF